MADPETLYLAEPAEARIVDPLDMITLIYQRRSGITHMVGEPVPQMLEAMGSDAVDAATLASRLEASFDLGGQHDAVALITERLEELAELGLVERSSNA
ncbi:HPr-rel-A system PqqD family peptide chaperone [uncultured Sphingorhabdus sp.]|uniref:HPr-rel-A system PqqD family peptide chaperone n=1 Tax=uncultured Sphingorhabdus sp. TaxID=1686106 RepID=UPI002601F7FC|nr:HPr-rel-A system PqqD family peptide chaperone [uncultured Sphingorhabdus sp.]HMS21934.1 HPr-rel-A system PqqD family peptide chaperone [Sphingorhabdus sp.]